VPTIWYHQTRVGNENLKTALSRPASRKKSSMDSDELRRVTRMKQIRIWLMLAALISAAPTSAIRAQQSQNLLLRVVDMKASERPAKMKVNPKDGLTYVWIPAGAFTMGCSAGDNECFDEEKPAHEVSISNGFWIGQTLVTQEAYARVVRLNPSRFKGKQLPVETVSWDEAQNYCRAVGMRLPTEAEWEYAARAGSTHARYGDLDAIAWYAGNSGPQPVDGTALYQSDPKHYEDILIAKGNQTHAVGQKQANPWQLYDVLGNVWEWTADWLDKNYYGRSEARDPPGPSAGTHRVLRGGAWDDNARNNRVSNRYWLPPDSRYFYAGFRCAGQ
jgi:formylglycine-generating enzyme required for sulfatase activity